MQVVPRPKFFPGVCIVTNSDIDTEYVDTGVDKTLIDGRIYVSANAVRDMAKLLGIKNDPIQDYDMGLLLSTLNRLESAERYHAESLDHLRAIRSLIRAKYGDMLTDHFPPEDGIDPDSLEARRAREGTFDSTSESEAVDGTSDGSSAEESSGDSTGTSGSDDGWLPLGTESDINTGGRL